MTIQTLKLVNGDEIIGDLRSFDHETSSWLIKKPLKATIMRTQDGRIGKALMDILVMCPDLDSLRVPAANLLFAPVSVPKEIEDEWRQQTSGIVLATQLNG